MPWPSRRRVLGSNVLPPMLIGFPSGAALVRAVFRRRAQDPASCSPGRRPDGCLRRDTSGGSLSAHVLKYSSGGGGVSAGEMSS